MLNEVIQHIVFCTIIISLFMVKFSKCGANNLHLNDGTSAAEVIAHDIFFEITEPVELEYTYRIRPARDFGVHFNSLFFARNIRLVPVQPQYGCTHYTNAEDIQGSVVLIERGQCSFKTKTILAENVGAKAVIITDESVELNEYFIEMIDDTSAEEAHIPAGFLLGMNGYMIRNTLKKLNKAYAVINIPVNLTFTPLSRFKQPPWHKW